MDKNLSLTAKYINFFYLGLSAFYPNYVFGEKAGQTHASAETWQGWKRMEFVDYLLTETKTDTLEAAVQKVLKWKSAVEEGQLEATIPPQEILETEVAAQEDIQTSSGFERERQKKETLLESQKRLEAAETEVKTPTPETAAKVPVPTKTDTPPSPGPVFAPSTLTQKIAIQITPVPLNVVQKVATAPLRFLGNFTSTATGAKDPVQGTLAKSAFDMNMAIPRMEEWKKAVEGSNVSENSKLVLKQMADLAIAARRQSVLGRALGPFVQRNRVVISIAAIETGLPVNTYILEAASGRLGGQDFSSYKYQPSFFSFRGFFGRVGNQLFGGLFKGGTERVLTRGAIKVFGKTGGQIVKKGLLRTILSEAGAVFGLEGWIASEVITRLSSKIGQWLKDHKELAVGLLGGLIALPFAGLFGALGVGVGLGLATGFVLGGSAGFTSAAAGIGGGISYFFSGLLLPSIAGPIIFALLGVPLIIALILFIINSGAYIVPGFGSLGSGPGSVPQECAGGEIPKPENVNVLFSGDGRYAFPVAPYGETYQSCTHWDKTLAIDIGIVGATRNAHNPVVAYTSGRIELISENDPKGGKYIILAGSDGRYYYYAHNCSLYVSSGQTVSAGEVIATTDNSGSAANTPEHLHFAISSFPTFYNGGSVCPSEDFENKFGIGKCSTNTQCSL